MSLGFALVFGFATVLSVDEGFVAGIRFSLLLLVLVLLLSVLGFTLVE
jgi:hypothetical protein